MKRLLAVSIFILFCSFAANAQTHSATLTWTNPVVGAVYNIYRAPCTGTVTANACSAEGQFIKISTTAVNASSFIDSTITAGQAYAWYATTFCAQGGSCPTGTLGESGPSNHIAVTTPTNIPPPPTNLSITNLALTTVGNQDRLQVDWTDENGSTSAFTIFGGQGQVLKQGSQTSSIGVYSFAIRFPPQSGTFVVCNQKGTCVAKTFQG